MEASRFRRGQFWLMGASPWIILGGILIYGVIHSFLASLWTKARLKNGLGPLAQRGYRLAYNLFAGVTLLPLLALPGLLPDRGLYRIPFPWLLLSIFFQVVAAAALGVGLLQTGLWSFLGIRQLLGSIENEPPVLVVHGLYRWVRHPLYTAGLVFIWLIPVMTVNLLAFNIGLSGYILVGAIFEERKLLKEYGTAYAEYRARTPMLVPGLRWGIGRGAPG